ncbi:hypothetical protein [Micromonospora sp. NPDC005299]|uniref:hypothetical protein n=1 Tax=Micromonospora sp. NPDC005299 TaxID=3364231 RepID=UPI003690A147
MRGTGKILVVEPNPSGHRLLYVRLIVERAVELEREFSVALRPGVEDTDEYKTHLSGVDLGTILRTSSTTISGLLSLAHQSSAELIVVPDGDQLAIRLGAGARWASDARLSLLVMRATAQGHGRRLLDLARRIVRRALVAAASARPRVSVTILRSSWIAPSRLGRTVGDPISITVLPLDRPAIRSKRGLDPGRFWFAVLGAVTERKNADLVAQALLALPSREVGLVVAGKIQPSVLARLQDLIPQFSQMGVGLVIDNRLLTDSELDEYVVASDCLVLAHSNEGPSGLFGKALVAGTRVLAAGARSLRTDARTMPSHARWVPLSVKSLAQGMAKVLSSERPKPADLPDPRQFAEALL